MSIISRSLRGIGLLTIVGGLVAFSGASVAAPLSLTNIPLFLPESVPPLNMLVLGRDHKLYYEAYNDYTDLNDDGVLDLKYKPATIDYYGYFDSKKCYTYSAGNKRFEPTGATAAVKTCAGTSDWSGDFLNYLTTSRIDALRKVLYGGFRSTDTASDTTLERSFIPQDAHSWGKEYTSVAEDGYDISSYSTLSLPSSGRHLFANTTPLGTTEPLLRILESRPERIWNWVSIERPVAGKDVVNAKGDRKDQSAGMTDLVVRVQVCASVALNESNCQAYTNGQYKPIGLLQEFGENDSMYFGLLSGSYAKNMSGGVLRREIGSIKEEIDPQTGIFRQGVYKNNSLTANQGIITTLNRLKTTGFGGNYQYDCGFNSAARTMNPGECQMWGNPIGEMLYESTRYFAGKASPTASFSINYGAGEEAQLAGGGLPVATWDDPYASRPVCSKPFETVISDINPSYDTDEVPGSSYTSVTGDLSGLNAASLGQTMWNTEFTGAQNIFIGDVGGVTDGAPTAKSVTSFGNIRGLSPEEPTKQGGYYSSSVAYYARKTDVNPAAGDQKVSTFSVALASPLPKIQIPVGAKTITLVPFAKSVAGAGIDASSSFQPTDQIVDFYVDTLTPTYGRFRVNFEDVEQGADHDMDAITVYEYTVANGAVEIKLTSEYAAGGITQHMGYVISGTDNKDGIYLEVLDQRDGDSANDTDFNLDTPPDFTGKPPAPSTGTGKWNDGKALPFVATRTFTPGATNGASILKDPLWYAAKWGGYDESFEAAASRNDIPDTRQEWDENNDGTPDNYFLVTNALKLSQQLRSAFADILKRSSSASSASVNSGSINSDTRIFQAKFNTGEWTGQLLSYGISANGVTSGLQWDASDNIPASGSRNIVTTNSAGLPIPFRWASLDATKQTDVNLGLGSEAILNYLRGDASNEGKGTGQFRIRTKKLGDIVSSSPTFVGVPGFRYRSTLESTAYSTFVTAKQGREKMVYAGANDGMLHGFSAETGVEKFAFIPSAVFPRLKNLASPSYSHQFYVDGAPSMSDIFIGGAWRTVLVGGLNKGGQEIYALNITDPTMLSSAEANPASVVMWEFKDVDTNPDASLANGDPDLGLTYSQPAVVKLRNGKWAAVFGNGYNSKTADGVGASSTTGNAVLFIVDMQTGNLIRKLDTGVGTAAGAALGITYDNGLATPALVDLTFDRVAETAYAGDLYGNMWRFDLSSTDPSQWNVAYSTQPLFTAVDSSGNRQPITERPEVDFGPRGEGVVVLFGTGKYLEPSDKLSTPTRVQSFYGIFDKGVGTSDRVTGARTTELIEQTILGEVANYDPDGTGPLKPLNLRVTSDNLIGTKKGWFIDLLSPSGYQGERQVSNPIVRDGNVIFTTLIPDADPCKSGGRSWLMEMSTIDGKRSETSSFDLNRDGKFTTADNVTITVNGVVMILPATGLGSDTILQTAATLDGSYRPETTPPGTDPDGSEVIYLYFVDSDGQMQQYITNPGPAGLGRQAWRQVR